MCFFKGVGMSHSSKVQWKKKSSYNLIFCVSQHFPLFASFPSFASSTVKKQFLEGCDENSGICEKYSIQKWCINRNDTFCQTRFLSRNGIEEGIQAHIWKICICVKKRSPL